MFNNSSMFQVATALLVGQAHASWHHKRPTMVGQAHTSWHHERPTMAEESSEGQQQDKVTLTIIFESVYNGNHSRMFIF